MRNRFIKLLASGVLIILVASCSGGLFTKVQVKATPTVNAALGSTDYLISDYFTVSDVTKQLGDSGDMTVYDYVDSTTTQKFLVHMPIVEVPLEFDNYMSTTINQAIDPVSIDVPSISFSQTIDTPVNINSMVLGSLGAINVGAVPTVEPGPTTVTKDLPPTNLSLPGFDTATFSSGSLDLVMSVPGATSGFMLTVTNITLSGDSGVITSATPNVNIAVAGGRTISLPLANKTLESSMTVTLGISTTGGTALTVRSINITAALVSCVITGATGIDFEQDVPIPATTIPIAGTFIEAVVETGSISLAVATLPAAWTGFTKTTTLGVTQTSGLNFPSAMYTTSPINLDLSGKTINDNDISVSGNVNIKAENASFSGLSGGSVTLTTAVSTNITKLTSVTIVADAGLIATTPYSEPMSADLVKWVNYIDFTTVGLDLTLDNTLPAGNDLNITVASSAFGIAGSTQTYPAALSTKRTFSNSATPYRFIPSAWPNIDFAVTITPLGYNSGTGNLTLYGITPGQTITFSGTVEVITDWSEADVDPQQEVTGSFPEAGQDPIDLSELSTILGDNLGFGPIPVNFYLSGLNGMTMTGKIWANYTDGTTPASPYFLGDATTTGSISVVSALPVFPAAGITVFDGSSALPTPSITQFDLQAVLNAKPADLTLGYSLTANSVIIHPADLVAGGALKAELVMLVPLALQPVGTAPPEIVIDQVSKTGDDLFGRKVGDDTTDIDKAFDSLVSMQLSLALNNTTGLTGSAFLRSGTWVSNELIIGSGVQNTNLTLDKSDIYYIKTHVPFAPDFVIEVPSTGISLSRSGGITVGITVSATTDVDQTFDLGGN